MEIEQPSQEAETLPDQVMPPEEPVAKRPRREEAELPAGDPGSDAAVEPAPRFGLGQEVIVNLSQRAKGCLWKRGTIFAVSPIVDGSKVPYCVKLDGGKEGFAPEDDDDVVRLAARATADLRVMRVFALPESKRRGVQLRFIEGERVAVQLDVGVWEEGTVVEVWAVPERRGRALKAWGGLAVPYAVLLDLGDCVMVPFDTDEVIRPEGAARPPQKSVEELIGGKSRVPPEARGRRFTKRRNAAGQWVLADTVTGGERPCSAPESDEDT